MHAIRTDDIIAAIASPPGLAVRGILRVTGPDAIDACAKMLRPLDNRGLAEQAPWRIIPGWLSLADQVTIPANAVLFRPPRSYTGQELVELHVAGSPAVLEMALTACLQAGARLAEPGEFTARAFLTGRMDLVAAEAVAARIAAASDTQLAAAQQLAAGTLADRARGAAADLAEVLGLVEAGIDFADEPIEFINEQALHHRLAALRDSIGDLLARSLDMRRLETLPRVALLGPANVGKSSLLNRLSGLDRSICSGAAGTTRDVLSAAVDTPAGQVMLLDGPGLGPPLGPVDEMAQQAWLRALAQADLLLLVLDARRVYHQGQAPAARDLVEPAVREVLDRRPYMVVLNKRDLLDETQQDEVAGRFERDNGPAAHMICAVTGDGCEQLREAIGDRVGGSPTAGEGRIVLTARHGEALTRTIEAIDAAGRESEAELIALHLREAMTAVGQITGQVTTEDLLERVFSKFCIGK